MSHTTIYLLRHAQTIPSNDIPRAEWTLSSTGKEQAEQLVERVLPLAIDVVYSSPLRRAVETVVPFAGRLGLTIQTERAFSEQNACTSYMPPAEFQTLIAKYWQDVDFAMEGAESLSECQKRMMAGIREVEKANKGKNILISSHGEAIGALLKAFDSQYGYDDWARMNMPDVFKLVFSPDGAAQWDSDYKFEPIDIF
jgi:2,3-bisphosphoglycerate-dependent phosphoglycerate mutase